jgi:proteasome accessory factor B
VKQSKEERLLALTCALLAAPGGLTKSEIALAVIGYRESTGAAHDKMFERDKAELRATGVAIETLGAFDNPEDQSDARYRISRESFEWPANFELTPEKLALLELAAKVWNSRSVSLAASTGLNRLKSLGLIATDADAGVLRPRLIAADAVFEPLSQAIADLNWVRFQYQKPNGERSVREVMPWRLRHLEGQWVLLATEQGGEQARNFLLRRIIGGFSVLETSFQAPAAAEVSAAERSLEAFAAGNRAQLKITEGTEAWWHFGAQSEVELSYMDEALFAEELREYGNSIAVLKPESLAAAIRNGYREVLKDHA